MTFAGFHETFHSIKQIGKGSYSNVKTKILYKFVFNQCFYKKVFLTKNIYDDSFYAVKAISKDKMKSKNIGIVN